MPNLVCTFGYTNASWTLKADLTSEYASFPKQGSKRPWKLDQSYVLDVLSLRFGAVDDGTIELDRAAPR